MNSENRIAHANETQDEDVFANTHSFNTSKKLNEEGRKELESPTFKQTPNFDPKINSVLPLMDLSSAYPANADNSNDSKAELLPISLPLMNQLLLTEEEKVTDKVVFEFNISGMTCVACSSSIERLIHNQFDKRNLVSVSIVLLTNKMFCTFEAHVFHDKIVTPEMVCEEVDCIGFECQLLSITEMKGEE